MGEPTIYAITTAKGGVLKTTLTVNLAGILAKRGKRVLIIDLDHQGNAAHSFGIDPSEYGGKTIAEVLFGYIELDNAVVQVWEDKIDLVPAWREMCFFDLNAFKMGEPMVHLKNVLEQADLSKWDYILIDTPPNLSITVFNALMVADKIIVPYQPEVYGIEGLTRTMQELIDFKAEYELKMEVAGVVGTLIDNRSTFHSANLQEGRKWCSQNDITMFDTVINQAILFAKSIGYYGLPATLAPTSNRKDVKAVLEAYEVLADEIFEVEGAMLK